MRIQLGPFCFHKLNTIIYCVRYYAYEVCIRPASLTNMLLMNKLLLYLYALHFFHFLLFLFKQWRIHFLISVRLICSSQLNIFFSVQSCHWVFLCGCFDLAVWSNMWESCGSNCKIRLGVDAFVFLLVCFSHLSPTFNNNYGLCPNLAKFWCIPNRMKIFTEFNLAIWPRMVKIIELNIGKFWFVILCYVNHRWKILKNLRIS